MSKTYHLSPESSNVKTGQIPVTTSPNTTCPQSCPLRGNGCYAEAGPLAWHWKRVNEGKRGVPWSDFLTLISSIAAGSLWRHNQAGDLPGEGDDIDSRMLAQLVRAQAGKRGWTYTHKPVVGNSPQSVGNAAAVRYANRKGFRVNLSADTLAEADELAEVDCGPVVVVLPSDSPHTVHTPAGRKVVVCPAQRGNVTYADCGLCAASRSVIVGFLAHGRSAKRVESVCRR
jgi:hypothetical protein